jgi:hypothetical protein
VKQLGIQHVQPLEARFPGASGGGDRRLEAITSRLISIGFALALLGVAVQTVSHLTNALLLDRRFDSLSAGQAGEGNAFTWASTVAAFAAAFVSLLLAASLDRRRFRFTLLAATLAFLSLDDLAQTHEVLGSEVRDFFGLSDYFINLIWPSIYFPLLLFTFVVLWRVATESPLGGQKAIRAGLVLLASAVVAEVFATAIRGTNQGPGDWTFEVEVAVEEGLELAGWIAIATGLTVAAIWRLAALRSDEDTYS